MTPRGNLWASGCSGLGFNTVPALTPPLTSWEECGVCPLRVHSRELGIQQALDSYCRITPVAAPALLSHTLKLLRIAVRLTLAAVTPNVSPKCYMGIAPLLTPLQTGSVF